MDRENQWDIQYGDNPNPCFITTRDGVTLLYGNKAFLETLQVSKTDYGKFFYDIVTLEESQMIEPLPNWNKVDTYETDSYNTRLNLRFFMRATVDREENIVFCTLIPSKPEPDADFRFQEAMSRCSDILEETKDCAMNDFTALLAEFYNCELAYVYRFETEGVSCLGYWSADDFVPQTQADPRLSMLGVRDWFRNKNTPTLVLADSDSPEPQEQILEDMLELFRVRNVAFCKVFNSQGEVVGFVGISNRREPQKFFDRRLMNTITRFVSQEVMEGISAENLFKANNRDQLTGVYNREGYTQWMAKLDSPKSLGLISANVNGLKFVNENLGTEGGDQLIRACAHTLEDHFDYTFFRMSGDEFIGIVLDSTEEEFEAKVSQLHEAMRHAENYDFSFGHAFAKRNIDIPKLTLEAETIMYINKQEYYATTHRQFDSVRDNILADLLSYLANDEFMVYLQPQVLLKDGSLYGAEALIRRFDKTNQKMVFPDQFIPMYEQKSVIRHVDMFVVDCVCSLLQLWGKEGKAIPISVNLSRVTLLEHGIVKSIVDICDRYAVPHKLLVIEVTERVGLIENNVASSLITDFKDHGFHISLDDFGCAYSNIVTLAQIEVDEVKIDKSLVDDLTTNHKNRVLVKNVLNMCDELEGTTTLAEGIEDENQAELLNGYGCTLGQGYFYSRPIPLVEFEDKYIKV